MCQMQSTVASGINKHAFIIGLDINPDEPNYIKMLFILLSSIKKQYPKGIDIYCGIFSKRLLDYKEWSILKKSIAENFTDVFLVESPIISDENNRYFIRNYTKYFFSKKYNLLKKYKYLIYLDIDVLLLKPLNPEEILSGADILVEEVPLFIRNFERQYLKLLTENEPLFYNWFDIITEKNARIFDINYEVNQFQKKSDELISRRIIESGLKFKHQDIGAYYPKHPLTKDSILFHYDGFIDSGYFYKLLEIYPKEYKYYSRYIDLLGIINENEIDYWENYERAL